MRVTIAALALAVLAGCGQSSSTAAVSGRYDRQQLERALTDSEHPPGIVIGEFQLANKPVVDGDTIKVVGLDASLRLLGLDTEETFKNEKALRAYEVGFDEYLRNEQRRTSRPVKVATPLGMVAKKFADDFFDGVSRVRLERDHPKDIRDRYNRYLAYVFVMQDGKWVNYNVECVRAGMSPYFTKYGHATRFHGEFVQAQREARAAARGIWEPGTEHYRDYDARLAWWDARGEFVAAFEHDAEGRDDLITLTHWDALDRLAGYVGDEVELLATVGDIRIGRGGVPTRVMLARRMFNDFALIFFDDGVFAASRIAEAKGEFVRVRGTISEYEYRGKNGRDGEKQLQMVIKGPQQVVFEDTWAKAAALMPASPSAPPGDPTVPDPEATDPTAAPPTAAPPDSRFDAAPGAGPPTSDTPTQPPDPAAPEAVAADAP